MGNTYSQLYIQIVFAVKGRENLVRADNKEALEKYISGITTGLGVKLMAIYCMPDHTHLFVSIKPDIRISDMVRDIKANSSKWLNDNRKNNFRFAWQEGYGVFSYSKSQKEQVINYIINQAEHHRTKTFKEEYISLLKRFEIEYEEKYLFDWLD